MRILVPVDRVIKRWRTLRSHFGFQFFLGWIVFFVVVCPAVSGEPKLSQAQVVRIANDAARAAGYKLSDFGKPKIRYEGAQKDGNWSVFYEGKELRLGNHFIVLVEDATKRTTVLQGQ